MFYFVSDFTELEGLFVGEQFLDKWNVQHQLQQKIITIKITIFSIAMFKNSYFPRIHLPSCYKTVCHRTVQLANHIQSCYFLEPLLLIVIHSDTQLCFVIAVTHHCAQPITPPSGVCVANNRQNEGIEHTLIGFVRVRHDWKQSSKLRRVLTSVSTLFRDLHPSIPLRSKTWQPFQFSCCAFRC